MTFSVDTKAVQDANAALGLIEQLDELVTDLKAFKDVLPTEHKQELEVYLEKLSILSKLLDDTDEIAFKDKLIGKKLTKIERLNLGGEIVRMREISKLTVDEIASQLSLGKSTILRFLKYYDKSKPSEKQQIRRSSIFDTAEQLEKLYAIIGRLLATTELTDSENHVRGISELRQTIKLAKEVLDEDRNRNREAEFKARMVEVLLKYLTPGDRQKVLAIFALMHIHPDLVQNPDISLPEKTILEIPSGID